MTYFKGSITSAASQSDAISIICTQARTTIPSNPAWSVVEYTTCGGSNNYPCDVYKCSAAVSGLSADFYVALMQVNGTLYVGLAEGYNTTTHMPKRPAMIGSSAAQPLQSDGGLLPASTEMDWYLGKFNPGGGNMSVCAVSPGTVNTTDTYAISVQADGIILTIGSYGSLVYAGAYESKVLNAAVNDPLPIFISGGVSGNSIYAYSAATRHPMLGSQSVQFACALGDGRSGDYYGAIIYGLSNAGTVLGANGLDVSTIGSTDPNSVDLYQPIYAVKGILFNAFYTSYAQKSVNGYWRGYLKHLRRLRVATGVTTWDTVTIDDVPYTFYGTTGTAFRSD